MNQQISSSDVYSDVYDDFRENLKVTPFLEGTAKEFVLKDYLHSKYIIFH